MWKATVPGKNTLYFRNERYAVDLCEHRRTTTHLHDHPERKEGRRGYRRDRPASFIDIKGWKSQGNRLSPHTIKEIAGLVAEEEPETEDDNVGIGGTIEWDLEKGDKKVKAVKVRASYSDRSNTCA